VIIFEKAVKGVSAAGLAQFARRAQNLAGFAGEVNILVSGNRRLQDLNRRFGKKDRPTDVLSFAGAGIGDIAISAEMARQNADRYRHSVSDELKILLLHGMLHLAGYDHEADYGRMARREARLRAQLRLPGSLIARIPSSAGSHTHLARKRRQAPRRPR
jgi:probable rRNA maturation factor